VEVLQSGKEDGESELNQDLSNLFHKKHHSYTDVNLLPDVIIELIITIFQDGLKEELNNIMTETHVIEDVHKSVINVKDVHYGTEDME